MKGVFACTHGQFRGRICAPGREYPYMDFVSDCMCGAFPVNRIWSFPAEVNHGNVSTFMQTYGGDCTFVGSEILRGRDAVVARYRKFRLDRTTGNSGNTKGVFTLLFRNTPQGWKILLDPQELGAIVAPMATE